MNFKVKVGTFLNLISPVLVCSTMGNKKDYIDAEKISFQIKGKTLEAIANNGFIAISKIVFNDASSDFSPISDGKLTVFTVDFINSIKSYSNDDIVNINFDGNIIKITQDGVSDDQEQTLQGTDSKIEIPVIEDSFDKEFTVNKDVFTSSISSVVYATGFAQLKPHLQFIKMIIKPDFMGFIAGDGGRYEIYERVGPGFITCNKENNFYLSRDHAPTLVKMLSQTDDSVVEVKEKKIVKSEYANNILFNIKDTRIVIIGYDPGIEYPDVYKLVNRKSPCKAVTLLDDWKYICNGVKAVNNIEMRKDSQFQRVDLGFSGKKLSIKTKGTMSSSRTIQLLDSEGSSNIKIGADPLLDVVIKYSGKVQFELVDEKSPLICRLYAGDKISDGPFYNVNNAVKESRTILIAQRK